MYIKTIKLDNYAKNIDKNGNCAKIGLSEISEGSGTKEKGVDRLEQKI